MDADKVLLGIDEILELVKIGEKLEAETLDEVQRSRSNAQKEASSTESHWDADVLLEVNIERWFNEVDRFVRDSLSYDKQKMTESLKQVIQPLGHQLRDLLEGQNEIPVSLESSIKEAFDFPIHMLHSYPMASKQTGKSKFPASTFQPNSAFILMWMNKQKPELEDVSNTFKEIFDQFGIKARRADDLEHQDVITSLILDHIRESEFLIADLSGERPNVYYEVGYAHAIGKRPILFRKHGTAVHFDLSVHNVPEYSNITELKTMLRKRLEAMTGKQPKLKHKSARHS